MRKLVGARRGSCVKTLECLHGRETERFWEAERFWKVPEGSGVGSKAGKLARGETEGVGSSCFSVCPAVPPRPCPENSGHWTPPSEYCFSSQAICVVDPILIQKWAPAFTGPLCPPVRFLNWRSGRQATLEWLKREGLKLWSSLLWGEGQPAA